MPAVLGLPQRCTRANLITSVEVVDHNGEVSLGKQYAGRQVPVKERAPGVWLIPTATAIPGNERWLPHPETAADLEHALAWARANPPHDGNSDDVLTRLAAHSTDWNSTMPSRVCSMRSRASISRIRPANSPGC